jgi:hypothetical protein
MLVVLGCALIPADVHGLVLPHSEMSLKGHRCLKVDVAEKVTEAGSDGQQFSIGQRCTAYRSRQIAESRPSKRALAALVLTPFEHCRGDGSSC